MNECLKSTNLPLEDLGNPQRHRRVSQPGSWIWSQPRIILMAAVVTCLFSWGVASPAEAASGPEKPTATETGEGQVHERAVPRPLSPEVMQPGDVTDPKVIERELVLQKGDILN